MESWCLSKYKSSLMFIFMMIFKVGRIQGVIYIEYERRALFEIKASLHELPYPVDVDNILSTWVDHGAGGGYCDWERIKCDPTSGNVIELSLSNMNMYQTGYSRFSYYKMVEPATMIWPLNFSLFLPFKELTSLDLSWNCIGDTFVTTGLERLSVLKKLERLNLSNNCIETNIFPSLSGLVSLKILDLSYINGDQGFLRTHDISEFLASENLEVLDLTGCGYYGILQVTGSKGVSILRKLKVLNIGYNQFNESVLTSLSVLRSLKILDLSGNDLSRLFPSQELSHLTNLEKLDLSFNKLNVIPSIQGCKSLMRLERLQSITLARNNFNKSIISCLSFLPSLKILDLSVSGDELGSSFPMQELSTLRELTTLDLSACQLDSLTLNGTMSNLLHLNLDGSFFWHADDIMRSMAAFPSLRFLSLEECLFQGRLFANEFPNLPHLEVLLLRVNDFNGTLPMEALASFHHLEVLDLSYNNFFGSIPSTIKSLSSLKVISLAGNKLVGSLPSHGFCELKNLHEIDLSQNMFDGNLHECFNTLLSLKLFDISSNLFTGMLLPSPIANLTSLEYVDFSHNSFEGSFPFSSFSNHTKLEVIKFVSDNDKFEVETEEPKGWIPMFQLKVLVLSNCNINRQKGSVLPSFLVNKHKLQVLDMSENSIQGQFPNWLIKNNTMMKVLNLRNNLFGGNIMLFYTNHNIRLLDISRNLMTGVIPKDIEKLLPNITHLDLSRNSLDGVIPSAIVDLNELRILDLSHNKLSGEVPVGLFSSEMLLILELSNNRLHGEVLSGNLSFSIRSLYLDNNCFTGKIGNVTEWDSLDLLDISNNFFTGMIPVWISNMSVSQLVLRNNGFEGPFPCGNAPFLFLDMSENSFSGHIPSCLNMQHLKYLHLGSNRFTGSIPNSFRNLTEVLTLDVGNNYLSGKIPKFLGDLSSLRILHLGKNNFSGSIPKQLCQLTNVSLLDLSNNSLSGSIPGCLRNITGPSYQAFGQSSWTDDPGPSYYTYKSVLNEELYISDYIIFFGIQDEIMFTTKTHARTYKGNVLDIMSGLDLSCNRLTGDIPEELGLLIEIRVLNLSHNVLTGSIPLKLSNLINIESLDLSYNSLTGKVPSELIKLKFLAILNVSYNNLSGRLPEMKAQFSTFTKESYMGNPLLCGPPLENKCTSDTQVTHPSKEEGTNEKWYDMDMTSFYGSCGATWFVFVLGFATLLYINPYWRRRWLDMVEEGTMRSIQLLLCLTLTIVILTESTQPPFACDSTKPATKSYPFCNLTLPIPGRVKDLVSRLMLDEKISQLVNTAPAIQRLGIPAYEWWSEALHGVSNSGFGILLNGTIKNTTSFPQVILTAASFNARLWYRIGQAIGLEARAVYNQGQANGMTFWAPNINVFRDPRWGRGQETPGEDPLVSGKYAISYVRGVQGDTFEGGGIKEGHLQASACCKHFTAYDLDHWNGVGRFGFDAKVTKQDLADTYQPPFQSCIQHAQASGIMCAYNRVNGVPNCADKNLLSNIARKQWGFQGYIASDCDAVSIIYEVQNYTKTPEDAVSEVLKAGMDLNCGSYLNNHTKSAIQQKKLLESDIDRALSNLFTMRMRLGLFNGDPGSLPYGSIGPNQVCSKAHQDLALEAARTGIVLLKNSVNLLPLKKTVSSLAVIGPNANSARTLIGNYAGPPCKSVEPLKALQNYVNNTHYHKGCDTVNCTTASVSEAVEVVKKADYVVMFMGLDQTEEREDFDRVDLSLPGQQQDLITAVAKAAKNPVVLVLICGGPVDISFAKSDLKIGGILWGGYPGESGGIALAEVIFGDHNPGEKLPMTWYPKEFTKIPMTDMRMRPHPSSNYPGRTYRFYTGPTVYPFGYGLSYSNYTYRFKSVTQTKFFLTQISTTGTTLQTSNSVHYTPVLDTETESCEKAKFNATLEVQNHGEMDGKHAVLLFVKREQEVGGNESALVQLAGFESVQTSAGERVEVGFVISPCEHFRTANADGLMVVEEGSYYIVVGDQQYPVSVLVKEVSNITSSSYQGSSSHHAYFHYYSLFVYLVYLLL